MSADDECARCDRPRGHDGSCIDFDEFEKLLKRQSYSNPVHVEVEGWVMGMVFDLLKEARRLKSAEEYLKGRLKKAEPYEEALNTIAQQHCVCEEMTDYYYEDDVECGSCMANRTLDQLKKGEI